MTTRALAALLFVLIGCSADRATSGDPAAAAPRRAKDEAPEAAVVTWDARRERATKLIRRGPSPQPYEDLTDLPKPVEAVEYTSGTLRLKGWFVPAPVEGRAPVLVYLHGGFAFGISDLEDVHPFHAAGFHVFAPAYRGENGNPGDHELAYGEVEDAIAAISWVREQPNVDADRVFVLGHSAGGMIAALIAVVPDLPITETASAGGIYVPDVILSFDNLPFDTSDPDEARFRSLLTFQRAMQRSHVAYVGDQDGHIRVGLDAYRSVPASKLEIIELPGDHFASLSGAVLAYLKRAQQTEARGP